MACIIKDGENVALLAEGVDRNKTADTQTKEGDVALLAEGVDRNAHRNAKRCEIVVALLAEGVDRNSIRSASLARVGCRPPRGGRG